MNDPIDQENFLVTLTWGGWRVILTTVVRGVSQGVRAGDTVPTIQGLFGQ